MTDPILKEEEKWKEKKNGKEWFEVKKKKNLVNSSELLKVKSYVNHY